MVLDVLKLSGDADVFSAPNHRISASRSPVQRQKLDGRVERASSQDLDHVHRVWEGGAFLRVQFSFISFVSPTRPTRTMVKLSESSRVRWCVVLGFSLWAMNRRPSRIAMIRKYDAINYANVWLTVWSPDVKPAFFYHDGNRWSPPASCSVKIYKWSEDGHWRFLRNDLAEANGNAQRCKVGVARQRKRGNVTRFKIRHRFNNRRMGGGLPATWNKLPTGDTSVVKVCSSYWTGSIAVDTLSALGSKHIELNRRSQQVYIHENLPATHVVR